MTEHDNTLRASRSRLRATLFSEREPTEEQYSRFRDFLRRTYHREIPLRWEKVHSIGNGFRLQVGSDIYDWTLEGRARQFRDCLRRVDPGEKELLPLLRQAVEDWSAAAVPEEIGEVLRIDGEIAAVGGLPHARYGEILLFSAGVRGMIMDLRREELLCILFEDSERISAGSIVRRTLRTAGMPVGSGFLGRVTDALGSPVDGKGAIRVEGYRPIEAAAPGILDRQSVNAPLETGILAIDSMFPIGRGQRELIIGDRQTGKTSIALDTILNQLGKNVVCIYVAIGQKTSSVAQLVENLAVHGALEYTAVITAPASAPAALQYVAPYAGCALGEHFMYQGRDVLIVYDDLTRHAVAYRTLSLLMERSPGREAYPGDIFYLHSRLLERSAHLSEELGGGSMTALPIAETQSGDISAYIPTNIISITDGQIFLEQDLFFAGQRPAIHAGLSVSRVGGDAQSQAMKTAAGTLRLDLAQYREIEIFTQFSSDLDPATLRQLSHGQRLMALLRQGRCRPRSRHQQVILLTAAAEQVLEDVPPADMEPACRALTALVETELPDLCLRIDLTGAFTPEDRADLLDVCRRRPVGREADG